MSTTVQTAPAVSSPTYSSRLVSIDIIRGAVMVIMAIDHVRVFSGLPAGGPTPGIFFTRWVTHFCAPAFIFLAGTSSFLYARKHPDVSRFLLLRGLWLIALELTVLRLAWTFNFDFAHYEMAGVLWAIGCCMILLAALVKLPLPITGAIGIIIIAAHNLLDSRFWQIVDGLNASRFSALWKILYIGFYAGPVKFGRDGPNLIVLYSIVQWIGVMAAGYGLGAMFLLDRPTRRRQLLGLGIVLTLLFVGLRYYNLYGDPQKYAEPPARTLTMFGREWDAEQSGPMMRLMAFLNCTKYPPSLLFLLMTLGPAIVALAVFDRPLGWLLRPFLIFGRVPLFFYLLHLPLIHGVAVAVDYYRFGYSPLAHVSFFVLPTEPIPPGYGLDLPMVYAVWFAVVVVLFPFCYAYSRLKRRYPGGILSYL